AAAIGKAAQKRLKFSLGWWRCSEEPDPSHPIGLLRASRQRPRRRRAAEQREELAPLHSITSSARASRAVSADFWVATRSASAGTSRPSGLAVLRLMTVSYLVGACTGRSAGFSPLRMR